MSALSWPVLGQMTGGGSGEHHLDFKPVDTSKTEDALRAAETACRLAMEQIPQEMELSRELLVYPEGEGDAVTITERDMEELQPGKFLGNNIVDFYIRFLGRRLPPEHGKRLHFFNSFFFRKLLQSTAPTRIDPCKVDYEQLRRWTENVNLFEKDYVFIPILESSHWSLVIICHLSSLVRASDEMTRFPCMVHLDPIRGQHESFEGLIRSYVLQAWMERYQPSIDRDSFLALSQMKYVEVEVPQQHNFHDCGFYLLNYIEAFLVEFASSDFSFPSSGGVPHFIHLHFTKEVLSKRKHILNLILELSCISQERARKCKARKSLLQKLIETSCELRACLKGDLQVCIQDTLIVGPTIFNDQGVNCASNQEDPTYVQPHQSIGVSRENTKLLSGLEIGNIEYENGCENLSPKQQHVELEVENIGPSSGNDPIFGSKHASTHKDAIDVQHQQPKGISKLDNGQLDGLEYGHGPSQRIVESCLDKDQHCSPQEVPYKEAFEVLNGKNKRGRTMTKEETWVLLSCKVQKGRFCKGRGGATNWNLISKEIGKQLGSLPSANQCRLRYDTLLKAYKTYKKYCKKTGKTFSAITRAEQLDMKLATTLSEEWYTTMDEICAEANVCEECMELNSNVCNDLHRLGSPDSHGSNLPLIFNGRSCNDGVVVLNSACETIEVALHNVIPARVFSSLSKDLQFVLFNLVQECSLEHWPQKKRNREIFYLEGVCRSLAILQDCKPSEILNYVFKLWEFKLVRALDMVFEDGKNRVHLDLWKDKAWVLNYGLYEKISKEVLCKNPKLKTYYNSFPIEQSFLQYIRVLSLIGCYELKHLDLNELPSLQSLQIVDCKRFNSVIGWENATSLGSLNISWCNAYCDFPRVRYLLSLREILISGQNLSVSSISWHLSQFNQCAKLRRLEIWYDETLPRVWFAETMPQIVDLENFKELKLLEFLSLRRCYFSIIQGLGGLQALRTLDLHACQGLKKVLELDCLKELTHLNLSWSSVEDIVGIEELHLLTSLDLFHCNSLKWLPFLGHLKALIYLNLKFTCVKEIPGKEGLISLKTLYWD